MSSSSRSAHVLALLFLALAALVLYSPGAQAQIGATSSVAGQVVDQQGGVIVGATVTLTNPLTKSVHTQDTNDAGRYIFPNLQPGVYDVSVTKTGFQTSQVRKQEVIVGIPVTLDFTLKVGESTQTVEVISTPGAELQTSNSTMGATLGGNTLLLLPNAGRDASALVTLQAATLSGGQVAGQENDQNTFMIDGANNSQDMDGGNNTYLSGFGGATNGTVPTPQESIEEFKVNTNNQTADFFSSAGAQVQFATKRGTDSFHGSAYEFFQGDWLNSNDFTNNANGLPRQTGHQNRFGGALGGPLVPWKILGGKTYVYMNYEGRRLPQVATGNRQVPTALMRAGVLEFKDNQATPAPVYYNFNNAPVTVGGTTYQVGSSADPNHTSLDPRNLGLNADVNTIWTKYMPLPNNTKTGDVFNIAGFNSQYTSPIVDDTGVVRIDHDLSQKWQLMGSYRIYKLSTLNTTQNDIGGFLPGDTFGQEALTATRPAEPSLLVIALSGQISPNLTNDFHWNYTRDDWQWATAAAPLQIPGVSGALEIGGETANALIPINVNAQQARQRIWDGHDYYYKDDLSYLHGNHFIQFGGQVNRNFDFHNRDDSGSTVFAHLVYLIGSQTSSNPTINFGTYVPTACSSSVTSGCLPSNRLTTYENDAAMIMGIVSQPQELATRAGANLALQSLGTPLFDQSHILTYDTYFSDSWHVKPNLTVTYGMNYGIQMPPFEENGKQVMTVDSGGVPVVPETYLANRYSAAINGNFSSPSFNPELGFATVGAVGSGRKYPYNPFYGGFGPHVSVAWSPAFDGGWKEKLFGHNSTVIRGGYARIYDRLNGVDLVLVPLLGVGFGQSVVCQDPTTAGTCAGNGNADLTNAFRIGTDGNTAPLPTPSATLPQPIFTGVNGQGKVGNNIVLDPTFRPGSTDQFNFSIQRTLPQGFLMELGYIGVRAHHLYEGLNIDAVPWMSTVNGQTFASAYANVEQEQLSGSPITPQNFFEGALAGSPLCTTSCTAGLFAKESGNFAIQQVSNIWSAMGSNNGLCKPVQCFNPAVFPAFNPSTGAGGTMAGINQFQSDYYGTSLGWSNYNAGFVSIQKRASNGLTVNANFTYSHALSTINGGQAFNSESGANPWDLHSDYSDAGFDQTFIFNLVGLYQLPFGKGQNGLLGHIIGGWSVAPILTWQSGTTISVRSGGVQQFGQGFGEANGSNAILIGGKSALNNAPPGVFFNQDVNNTLGVASNGNPENGGFGVNLFKDPGAAYALWRPAILGLDTTGGGNGGNLRGPNSYNLDLTVAKEIKIREAIGATFTMSMFNALNHANWTTGNYDYQDPADFGTLGPSGGAQSAYQRVIQLGLRVHF